MKKKLFTAVLYIFALIGFVLTLGFIAIKLNLTRTQGIVDNQRNYIKEQVLDSNTTASTTDSHHAWAEGKEWQVLRDAIIKDTSDINKAAKVSNSDPRLIVSMLIVEQLRLFHTNREVFKQVFEPLKILGTQSQFSWGVMGIKQETAQQIEQHLKDSVSPYYLGTSYEHVLDFATKDQDTERFDRLTNESSRYYSYLYTGLYIEQVKKQWQTAGHDIGARPEIISTLFNIGFQNSKPKRAPQVGGARIDIGTTTYSFGGLAGEFYNSSELPQFPKLY